MKTPRGFSIVEFNDADGDRCSLQQSSATDNDARPGASMIWLGIERSTRRMHLNRRQVQRLIDLLKEWVETGDFKGNFEP